MAPKRAALIVIDGWGINEKEHGNCIAKADTPVMDKFKAEAGWAVIEAAGLAVGLPENTMGNSEVGHLTIGAGAVDYQDLVKINLSVKDGDMPKQKAMADAFAAAKSGTGRLHLWGLLSDGGVHSHQEHLYAIVAAAKEAGVPRTLLHVCMDGRDTPPTSGASYMELLEKKLAEIGHGEISTIVGRYYAMDRDKRWERVQQAYDVMCREDGKCETVAAGGVKKVIEDKYALEKPEQDEFVLPTGVLADGGIADGDVFMCFNFPRRPRARDVRVHRGRAQVGRPRNPSQAGDVRADDPLQLGLHQPDRLRALHHVKRLGGDRLQARPHAVPRRRDRKVRARARDRHALGPALSDLTPRLAVS